MDIAVDFKTVLATLKLLPDFYIRTEKQDRITVLPVTQMVYSILKKAAVANGEEIIYGNSPEKPDAPTA